MSQIAHPELEGIGNYEFGWSDKNDAGANSKRGLNEEVVRDISAKKNEPAWMLELSGALLLFFKELDKAQRRKVERLAFSEMKKVNNDRNQ